MSEDSPYLPDASDPPPGEEEEIKAPISFKLMIVLVILYLGWRLVQGVMWVIDRVMS